MMLNPICQLPQCRKFQSCQQPEDCGGQKALQRFQDVLQADAATHFPQPPALSDAEIDNWLIVVTRATPERRTHFLEMLCAQAKRANALEAEVDLLRMQAAACMTATLQNTLESAKQRIGRDNPYWTQAYQDVCDAVDREMQQRESKESAERQRDAAVAALKKLTKEKQMNAEQIARVCHEVNRAYCLALGDTSQPEWADAPDWQKSSAINGVNFHLANPDAGADHSHNEWLKEKRDAGWKFGPVKDAELKEHPCFVPYEELPTEQKAKDYLFRGVIHALK